MAAAFATVPDLEDHWRPLDPGEESRAERLLDMAAVLIRRHVTVRPGSDDEQIAQFVSLEMVRDAMVAGEHAGKSTYSTRVGQVVDSATLTNPAATLRFTAEHKAMFGLASELSPRWSFGGGC